jgi:hypothetical protein
LFQFTLSIGLAYILWLVPHYPFGMKVASVFAILWSLSTLGGLLDGRSSALSWELLRLSLSSLLGLAIAFLLGYTFLGIFFSLFMLSGILWISLKYSTFQANTSVFS